MVTEDVEKHQVVNRPVLVQEVADIGNYDREAIIGLAAKVAGCGGHDWGGDFDADETGARQVVVKCGGEASSTQTAQKDGPGGRLPDQCQNHRLRVGALEPERCAQIHGALDPISVGGFRVQHPQDEALTFPSDCHVVSSPLLSIEGGLTAFSPALGVALQAVSVGLLPYFDRTATCLAVCVHGLTRAPQNGTNRNVNLV